MRALPDGLLSAPSRWLGLLVLSLCAVLAASGCTAFSRAVRDGDEFTAQRKWPEAEAAYQRALAVDPKDSEVLLKLRAMRRQWSAEVLQSAEAVHGKGDLAGATPLLVRALELDPENEAARGLLTRTLDARVEAALAAAKAEKLQEARAELDAVLAVDPGHAGARKGVNTVQVAWARRWFGTAQRLEEEGKLGNALLAYVRADQERVGATAARERAEAVRRKLRDEVAFLVVTGPAEDRANAPDVAQRLTPGRLAALLPQEVPIRVVTEAPSAAKVGVRLKMALERVLPLKSVEEAQRTQRYLVGNRSVPSPRRAELEAKLLEAERKLEEVERKHSAAMRDFLRRQAELAGAREVLERCRERERKECRDALAECGEAVSEGVAPGKVPSECSPEGCRAVCAQEESGLAQKVSVVKSMEGNVEATLELAEAQRREVQRARDAFFREPPTVDEPMHDDFVFDVQVHRLTVKASVTSRLEDLANPQAVSTPHTGDYAAVHEDVSHKGYERYKVLADPVQLRNELELRIEAGDKAMEAVAARVRDRFDAYRQRRVEDARRGMVRPSTEEVVETAVRALLLTADKPPADILEPLAKARGLTRPEALFRH